MDLFVQQVGRTFKAQEGYLALQKACAELGDDTLAERAFGVNHTASIVAIQRKERLEANASLDAG